MKKTITSFSEFISVAELGDKGEVILWRGQPAKDPLLPSITRKDPSVDTTEVEKAMLIEFKRRATRLLSPLPSNDWEWLIHAQHYGMKTRLLDWSGNPLVALWFACCNEDKKSDSYVYGLINVEKYLLNNLGDNPFDRSKTRVIKPALNNDRIIAQSGWFTVHKYSAKANRFVPLNSNSEIRENIAEFKIPGLVKHDMLLRLDRMGIDHNTIFPGVEGVCRHLNWLHE